MAFMFPPSQVGVQNSIVKLLSNPEQSSVETPLQIWRNVTAGVPAQTVLPVKTGETSSPSCVIVRHLRAYPAHDVGFMSSQVESGKPAKPHTAVASELVQLRHSTCTVGVGGGGAKEQHGTHAPNSVRPTPRSMETVALMPVQTGARPPVPPRCQSRTPDTTASPCETV